MKTLTVICALLLSINSFAGDAKPRTIPVDAELLYTSEISMPNNAGAPKCEAGISAKLIDLKTASNADVICKTVFYKITSKRTYVHTYGSNYHRVAVNMTMYCQKRPFSDLAALSLFESCQKNPQEKCFQPEILQRLDQIKPTQYFKYEEGSCS